MDIGEVLLAVRDCNLVVGDAIIYSHGKVGDHGKGGDEGG